MTRCYSSAVDFKQALEDRLRRGTTGFGIQRRRQLLVFQRLLARVASGFERSVVLKGGLCLEIRIDGARTTRDIDLVIFADEATILARLQALGQLDLGDFMTFEIQPDRTRAELTGDGLVYGGRRFRVECKLAGKIYGARFGLDVVFGGHMLGNATPVRGEDYLGFAGIPAPELLLIPVETHLAEKLHAYTLPRPSPNSRVRDLPDMALLATIPDPLDGRRIAEAIRQTFQARATHDAPGVLPPPARVLADALRGPRRRAPASMACPRRTGPCRTGVPRSRPARGGLRPVAPRAVALVRAQSLSAGFIPAQAHRAVSSALP